MPQNKRTESTFFTAGRTLIEDYHGAKRHRSTTNYPYFSGGRALIAALGEENRRRRPLFDQTTIQHALLTNGPCNMPSTTRQYKEDLLDSILAISDDKTRQTALLHALLPGAYLGSIFYIQRLGSKPSVANLCGTLRLVANALNKEDMTNFKFDSSLVALFASTSKEVINDLNSFSNIRSVLASQLTQSGPQLTCRL